MSDLWPDRPRPRPEPDAWDLDTSDRDHIKMVVSYVATYALGMFSAILIRWLAQ